MHFFFRSTGTSVGLMLLQRMGNASGLRCFIALQRCSTTHCENDVSTRRRNILRREQRNTKIVQKAQIKKLYFQTTAAFISTSERCFNPDKHQLSLWVQATRPQKSLSKQLLQTAEGRRTQHRETDQCIRRIMSA